MSSSERRGPQPETRITPPVSSWERITTTLRAMKRHADETYETGHALFTQPEVKEGSEAAFRAAMNIAISCVDLVPIAGEIASWGADFLKIIETIRYHSRQKDAMLRGEDPTKVQREKYNLTPDVSVLTAVLSEGLEVFTFVMLPVPTHAIETTIQLRYDIPRMYRGVKKAREVLTNIRAKRERARQAAEHLASIRETLDSLSQREEK